MKKLTSWVLLIAAGVCLCLCAGCVREDKDPTNVVFSPDGTQIAYSWAKQWRWAEQDEGYFLAKNTEFVGYGPVDAPTANFLKIVKKSVKVPDYQAKLVVKKVTYSPDNQKLAVVCEESLQMIDLNTNALTTLSLKGEKIGSLVWLNDDEVIYTAQVPDNDYRKKKRTKYWPATFKAVFRQLYSAPAGKRTEMYRDVTTVPEKPAFVAYWSPDNKSALLAGPMNVRLLNLETGRFTDTILERYGEIRGVAWKPDSSEVFIGFGWPWDQKGKSGAIKLERATGKVTDYGEKIRKMFGTEPFRIYDWTKDGKYIVAWGMMTRTCLINLDPWKILWFEDDFNQKLPKFESQYRIIRSLKPGWLWLRTHEDSKTFAVDYYGRHIVPIAERVWAINEDATLIAEVPTRYMISIRKLVLPKLAPPPKPTAKQKYWTVPSAEIEGSDEKQVEKTEEMYEDIMEQNPQPESVQETQPADKSGKKTSPGKINKKKSPTTQPGTQPAPDKAVPEELRYKMPKLQEIRHPAPDEKNEPEKEVPAPNRKPIEI